MLFDTNSFFVLNLFFHELFPHFWQIMSKDDLALFVEMKITFTVLTVAKKMLHKNISNEINNG